MAVIFLLFNVESVEYIQYCSKIVCWQIDGFEGYIFLE